MRLAKTSTSTAFFPVSIFLSVLAFGACRTPPTRTPSHPPTRRAERPGPLQLALARPGQPKSLVRIRPGERLETSGATRLTWDDLARRLARTRVIFVGERHDNHAHHRIQAAVVSRLARRAGGPLLMGMEMFYRGHAPAVFRKWAAGTLNEKQFLKEVDWSGQWGMNFDYYRPVFGAAKTHKLPIVGLNVPLKIARTVGRRGLSALSTEVRSTLPSLHLAFGRHRQVFRALLGLGPRSRTRPRTHPTAHPMTKPARPRSHGHGHGHGHMGPGFMDRLFAAQVLRDEVMAAEIVKGLDRAGPRSRMVVIVGNGHLVYHTGVNHRLRRLRPSWAQATVICVTAPPSGRRVSRGLGDYLIATPRKATRRRTGQSKRKSFNNP